MARIKDARLSLYRVMPFNSNVNLNLRLDCKRLYEISDKVQSPAISLLGIVERLGMFC